MTNYRIKDDKIEVTENPVVVTLSITEIESKIKLLEHRVTILNEQSEKTSKEKSDLENILKTLKQNEAK